VAGDFRLRPAKLGKGSQLIVAIRGKLSVSDEEIATQISKVVRMERTFWRDDKFPYYLVTIVPFDAGQSGSGGGGFTNAFSLHLSAQDSFSLSLVAHEVFHTWNPYRLGRMPSPPESIYWFTEGFTTYYQDLLLWRAGLLSFNDYLQTVNRFLRDYTLAPAKNMSLKELIERARIDQNKSRISYERGAAIALWLDWRIRENTRGRSSLDTLMFDLFRAAGRQQNGFPDLTPGRVFEAASGYIGAEDLNQLRSYVELGSTIEAPADAFGPCVVRELVDIPSFELGMNRVDLVEKHTVTGLQPGSNAQKAGLQEADRVIGTSIFWNDTSKPIKLTIRRGQATLTAEYYPRGPSPGLAPRFVLDAIRYRGDPESCHGPAAIR
jgi:predicted metalloprotease with PDZ domain